MEREKKVNYFPGTDTQSYGDVTHDISAKKHMGHIVFSQVEYV